MNIFQDYQSRYPEVFCWRTLAWLPIILLYLLIYNALGLIIRIRKAVTGLDPPPGDRYDPYHYDPER